MGSRNLGTSYNVESRGHKGPQDSLRDLRQVHKALKWHKPGTKLGKTPNLAARAKGMWMPLEGCRMNTVMIFHTSWTCFKSLSNFCQP